jgi:hypothetical protein
MEREMPNAPEAGDTPPEERESQDVPAPGPPEEALRRLEQRLDRASEAAERLMAQVAGEAVRARKAPGAGGPAGGAGNPTGGAGNPTAGAGAGGPAGGAGNPTGGAGDPTPGPGSPGGDPPPNPPPAGWQSADDGARGSTSELDPFVALVQAVRDLIPPDVQERLTAALREVLMALRALIDWYLERLDRRREQGVEVQDIPIL